MKIDFTKVPQELDRYPWPIMLKQGYHWMDRYGEAHWIPDMSTSYLENALRFAKVACRGIANEWWNLAMIMNGEMAIDQAERYASRYDSCEMPLVRGLENELARRRGEEPPYDEWQLSDPYDYLEDKGYDYMDFIRSLGALVPVNEQGEPIHGAT